MQMTERWTTSGVRLRKRCERPGDLDWLLLPGGPGIGSESLHGLADILDTPGRVWMVDLPETDPTWQRLGARPTRSACGLLRCARPPRRCRGRSSWAIPRAESTCSPFPSSKTYW